MATDAAYVRRFSRTERAVHWIHATAFFVLLGSGLVLYVPSLSRLVARRPLVKDVHVYTAVVWLVALALVVALGDRRGLRRTARELDLFDDDDRRWLRGRRSPQGRFNAGQKLNFWLTAAFAVLFLVTGLLLWYGERDTRFRVPNALLVHDALMYVSIVLVAGHLVLALVVPATRPALRGMLLGSVRADWARRHHAKWVDDEIA
jgi:formate dehydrogenase subunit gamma